MDTRLAGRTALVTGAGRGIGAAIAERLAADGARVAINDVDAAAAETTAASLRAAGADAVAIPEDVAAPGAAGAVVAATVERLGGLDVLVNNAAVIHRLPIREHTEEHWRRVLDVNLGAPFFLARAALDHLGASGHGAIVNVCSVAVIGFFRQVAYDVSKGGLLTLTRSLAVELGREGIRVNAVAPGFVESAAATVGDLGRIGEKTVAGLPIARMGQPAEAASAVAWLAGDESSYVTGQVLFVDGGWVRN